MHTSSWYIRLLNLPNSAKMTIGCMHSHLRAHSSTLRKLGCLHHPTLSARTKSVFIAVLHWCTIVFMRRLLRLLLFWASEFRKYSKHLKRINLVPGTADWPWFSSTHMRTSGLRCQGLWRVSGIWQRPGPANTPSHPQNAWSQRTLTTSNCHFLISSHRFQAGCL